MLRDLTSATLCGMSTSTERGLDEAAHHFKRAQARLQEKRDALHKAIAAAVAAGMSKSEAGRRSGYTREYVAKVVSE